jgi:acyl-CoA thioesterase II
VHLAEILDLEATGVDEWRAQPVSGQSRPDIFGGQVAGQALLAAAQTVDPTHGANSVHCSFLRRGQSTLPLDIRVDRTRAGRTYSNRRVEVRQSDKVIFTMLASFHLDEPGAEFDHAMADGIPDPDDLVEPDDAFRWDPAIEMRTVDTAPPAIRWWGRIAGELPDDPNLHRCALLYASDLRAGGAAMMAIGFSVFGEPLPEGLGPERPATDGDGQSGGASFGSLDHALWFHRAPRADEWFFCDVRPLTVRDSRGLVLGTIFDRAGQHLATFTQEMFLKA